MVKKTGEVTIKEDGITVTKFTFDCNGSNNIGFNDCRIEALVWAKKRIEEAIELERKWYDPK